MKKKLVIALGVVLVCLVAVLVINRRSEAYQNNWVVHWNTDPSTTCVHYLQGGLEWADKEFFTGTTEWTKNTGKTGLLEMVVNGVVVDSYALSDPADPSGGDVLAGGFNITDHLEALCHGDLCNWDNDFTVAVKLYDTSGASPVFMASATAYVPHANGCGCTEN